MLSGILKHTDIDVYYGLNIVSGVSGVFVHLSSLRLCLVALNTTLDLLLPVSTKPHDPVLAESDYEQRNNLTCGLTMMSAVRLEDA